MEITWYGTANLKVQNRDTSIHFDPYISGGADANKCSEWSCNLAEEIFITHGHFDHLMDVPELIRGRDIIVNCSDTAACSLLRDSVEFSKIKVIHAGDRIRTGSMEVRVLRCRHSRAGVKLFLKTFLSARVVFQPHEIVRLLKQHRSYPCGEVYAYHIISEGRDILHIGSMDIDDNTSYPSNVDLLMLPFQGCSDLEKQALRIINRISPKAVLLHHFDDSFPPVSRDIDTGSFVRFMKKEYPRIPVIVPEYSRILYL
jgi:L-ascorbate metabolism protein UlaG (beta-lactamase superfamily)